VDGNDELDLAFRAARAEQVDATAARIERAVRAKLFATIQRVGRYETRGVLGRGGLGVVFRGYDRALDRQVAIKLIRTEDAGITPQARARLLREARALAGIVHPNVLEIFDVGEDGEDVYLVSELVEGETLARWSARTQLPHDILERFVAAGRGLAAVHAAGLVHRDFKPANVVLADDARVKVIDFGLAKAISETLASAHEDSGPRPRSGAGTRGEAVTEHGTTLGTPRYMAPEQAVSGDVDARADVYAFCVALAEALGRERTSRRIAAVLARGMRIDPRERWPTMHALLEALDHARPRPRARTPLAITALVAAIGIALGSGEITEEASTAAAGGLESHAGLATKLRGAVALAGARARFGRGDVRSAATLAEQTYWTALRSGDQSTAVIAASDAMWLRATAGEGKAADMWYGHASASLARAPFAHAAELRFTALAAQVFERRGELARARDLARRRYDLAVTVAGIDATETDRARAQLGFVLARMGERDGIEWCEAALAGLEQRLGPRHPWSIRARVDLGSALQAANEHTRAIAALRDALVVADAADIQSLRTLAGAINGLALSRFQIGDDREADALFARAITLVGKALPSDRTLLLLLENRARVQMSLGRYTDASISIARAMDLAISRGEADTAGYASALEIAGMLDLRKGAPAGALARFDAALAVRRVLGDAARLHRTEVFVARALADVGRWRDAETLASSAMQALADLGAPPLGDGHALLGDIARERGDDDAVVHYRAALAAWIDEPADRDVIARTERSLARLLETEPGHRSQ
jgi:tetratricopeptide (TPR) repeat protein/predicted Ser/Thr protein kinase